MVHACKHYIDRYGWLTDIQRLYGDMPELQGYKPSQPPQFCHGQTANEQYFRRNYLRCSVSNNQHHAGAFALADVSRNSAATKRKRLVKETRPIRAAPRQKTRALHRRVSEQPDSPKIKIQYSETATRHNNTYGHIDDRDHDQSEVVAKDVEAPRKYDESAAPNHGRKVRLLVDSGIDVTGTCEQEQEEKITINRLTESESGLPLGPTTEGPRQADTRVVGERVDTSMTESQQPKRKPGEQIGPRPRFPPGLEAPCRRRLQLKKQAVETNNAHWQLKQLIAQYGDKNSIRICLKQGHTYSRNDVPKYRLCDRQQVRRPENGDMVVYYLEGVVGRLRRASLKS